MRPSGKMQDSSNCYPFLGKYSLRVSEFLDCFTGQNRVYDTLSGLSLANYLKRRQQRLNSGQILLSLVHSSLEVASYILNCYRLKVFVVKNHLRNRKCSLGSRFAQSRSTATHQHAHSQRSKYTYVTIVCNQLQLVCKCFQNRGYTCLQCAAIQSFFTANGMKWRLGGGKGNSQILVALSMCSSTKSNGSLIIDICIWMST